MEKRKTIGWKKALTDSQPQLKYSCKLAICAIFTFHCVAVTLSFALLNWG